MTTVAQSIEFYYGIGSRYSYLASTQLERLATETGCCVRWWPLYSGDLFAARGLDPFQGRPVSGQYDWTYRRHDAERWAAYYGVPYREPEHVPLDPRRLALACTAAAALGAVEPFSRRLFQALFVDGTSPLDDATCATLAREVGLDESAFRAALGHPETAARLAATVEEATARGLFGVPSFVVGHNLRAAYLHVLADALTSVLAIFALVAAKFFAATWLDPVMGIVGAALVTRWSLGLLRETSRVLLDVQVPGGATERLRQAIEAQDGDRVADLHLWSIGPGIQAAAIVVVSDAPRSPEHYRRLIPPDLHVVHATVEVHRCPHPA